MNTLYCLIHPIHPLDTCYFNHAAHTEIYTLSLHDALPIYNGFWFGFLGNHVNGSVRLNDNILEDTDANEYPSNVIHGTLKCRSEEHTSELQSLRHLVCRLLLEKKNINTQYNY